MKWSLFLCMLLAPILAQSQSILSITPAPSNTFTVTVSNSPAGKPCWISSGANLFSLSPLVYFPGTTNSFTVTVANDQPRCFFGAASDIMTATNFLDGSFVPYPSRTDTNRPCLWQAYPVVTYNQVLNGYGQILSINGTNWFLFVHANEILEIRTVQQYTNPPVFSTGAEIIVN